MIMIVLALLSGCATAPSQSGQIEQGLKRISQPGGPAAVRIHEATSNGSILLVCKRNDLDSAKRTVLISIRSYPFTESPDIAFPKAGVTVPEGWDLQTFNPENNLVEYICRDEAARAAPSFVNAFFRQCMKCVPDYKLGLKYE